MNTQGFGDKFK
jgi:hypothetical protein